MEAQKIILLIITAVGGTAVIGSYIFSLTAQSSGGNALWGGIPPHIRPIYVVSMILSALGFFGFFYFILFPLVPANVSIACIFGYSLFYIIFLAILVPSAFWMPLTNVYIGNPTLSMWVVIRIVLAVVGLASIALVWALLSLQTKTPSVATLHLVF